MKEEKEVLWLVNLLKRKELSNKNVGGFRYEFEKCSGSSLNNPQFHKLFNELVKEGSLELIERKKNKFGKYVDIYILKPIMIIKRLREIDFYNNLRKLILSKETVFGYGL